jgi:hypothetical protein
MKVNRLQLEQQAAGYTYKVVVTHEDLTEATADTAQVIELINVELGEIVEKVAVYMPTPFKDASDAAFNTNAATIGDGGSANRYLSSTELNVNGTEILAKAGTNTAGFAYVTDDTVDLTVAAMTAKSLDDVDTGELWIFIKTVKLPEF